jgi:tRNA threonylcarbamoyladenosine biosynthesis protein TsaE
MNDHAATERFCLRAEDTQACARELAATLRGGEIILLEGPLGAGKTCFTRGLAEGLGCAPRDVSSPTFALMHVMQGAAGMTLVHIDAYRMLDPAELDDLGWEAWVGQPGAVTAIEWASRLRGALPEGCVVIDVAIDHALRDEARGRTVRITDPRMTDPGDRA